MANKLKFPNFNDIKVSTKTFIIKTNLTLDLKKLFDFLPITEYTVIPKKSGRKKKTDTVENGINIKSGSIVTMKFENKIKGIELKPKKTTKKKSKWFRNSFTIVMIIDNKPINMKVCQNGVFQATGCKFDSQVQGCVKHIWEYIKNEEDNIYCFNNGYEFEALFIPAMRNIDFSVGFLVDREKLAKYMSTQTEFHSLLETSFGYTGVNIKCPITQDIRSMEIVKIHYYFPKERDIELLKGEEEVNCWEEQITTYAEYLKLLPEKEQQKKINKDRYNTFLIFHSGRIIMSSVCAKFAIDSYYYFINIIRTSYDIIEERLD